MGLRERIEALEPREQKLLIVLAGTFAVMVLLLIPLGVSTLLSQRQEENELLQSAIDQLYQQRGAINAQQQQRDQVLARYKEPVPPLAGFLTKLADASEVEIPEIKDGAPVPVGKKYEERTTSISIKKVGMFNLLKFLERIAQAQYPVSITKLNIRKRAGPPDNYDVTMTVSAYHRVEPEKGKGKSK